MRPGSEPRQIVAAQCLSWPFGHGGSYTTFALAWAAPPAASAAAGDATEYALTVTNSGGVLGDVVVACYVAAVKQAVVAPGLGRVVVSDAGAPNLLVNLVRKVDGLWYKMTTRRGPTMRLEFSGHFLESLDGKRQWFLWRAAPKTP